MTIIAPSVLSADFTNLKAEIEQINQSNATWIHYDVMDGHFVPNLSFGPDILKQLATITDRILDVHIMVSNPLEVIDYFSGLPFSYLTFHLEATNDNTLIPVIEKIKHQGYKVGISIKPNTPVTALQSILDKVDLVLLMSVEPGFGGQKFIETTLDKLDWLAEYRTQHQLNYLLEVDGGINQQTAQLAKKHHCDVLVAGSYVFKHPLGIKEAVNTLL